MKIAIVSNRFPPRWIGGTEIATKCLASSLSLLRNSVIVITSWDSGLPLVDKENGFIVIRIKRPFVKKFDPFLSMIGNLIFYLKTLIILKRIKPDIVHIQSLTNLLLCVLIKKILKLKCGIWARGSDIYSNWPLKRFFFKFFLNFPDLLLVFSRDMLNKVKEYRRKQTIILPNGINLYEFSYLLKKTKEEIREELNLPQHVNIIVYIGRLEYVKAPHLLLFAFKKVIKHFPESLLIIVGSGKLYHKLINICKKLKLDNKVLFTGPLPREKALLFLRASDLLVLPSFSEGFPLVILEAMAAQTPVIVSDFEGVTEYIRDGIDGLLVKRGDIKDLSRKVIAVLSDKKLRKQLIYNAYKKVKKYDWKRIALELLKHYSNCLTRNQ